MFQVVQEPPEQVRVWADAPEPWPAEGATATQLLLITRSNSSEPHFGQFAATSSSFFMTRISKHSLQDKHLNS
jgi:hypothetical protein